MNNLEKIADELIEKFKKIKLITFGCNDGGNRCVLECNMLESSAHKCAIESVNHTIEVLEELSEKTKIQDMYEENICDSLDKQLELKKILEQKSKNLK
jgi:hypothetical protein